MRRGVQVALGVLLLLAAAAAHADIVPSDVGPVQPPSPPVGPQAVFRQEAVRVFRIGWGPYGSSETRELVVREKDTLGEIAQRELGSARRHVEIQALNPGLDPLRLQPGTTLALPPRVPPGPDAALPWVHLFALRVPSPRAAGPLEPTAPSVAAASVRPSLRVAVTASQDVRLVLVEHASLAAFGAALAAGGPEQVVERLRAAPGIAVSGLLGDQVEAPRATEETHYVAHVAAVDGEDLRLDVTEESELAGEGSGTAPPTWMLALVLLLTVAAAFLALRAQGEGRNAA